MWTRDVFGVHGMGSGVGGMRLCPCVCMLVLVAEFLHND